MALFGTEAWTERGETFSVYFNMFSRLSPVTVDEGRLAFRRPAQRRTALGRRARAPSASS